MGATETETARDPNPADPVVLDLKNLVKVREQGGTAFELEVPEFRLRQGEFLALVGESGCGKSTLLDMLGLVLRPTSCDRFTLYEPVGGGKTRALDVTALWQKGDDSELARLRRNQLGYVLQSGGLLPFLTVRQNLQLPLRIKDRAADESRSLEAASRMGVEPLYSKKPQYLSGGQRQRVAILRAMVHRPMLILADEPTGAVDSQRAEAIIQDFRSLAKKQGTTIVMVTHNHRLIEPVADRTYTYRVSQISGNLTRSVCVPLD
jgi:putative ABC transport system ATP-binding protein